MCLRATIISYTFLKLPLGLFVVKKMENTIVDFYFTDHLKVKVILLFWETLKKRYIHKRILFLKKDYTRKVARLFFKIFIAYNRTAIVENLVNSWLQNLFKTVKQTPISAKCKCWRENIKNYVIFKKDEK